MSERWNFEMQDGKLMVCHNLHNKGQPCEYEPATRDDIEYFRKRIAELEAVAEAALYRLEMGGFHTKRILEPPLRAAGYLKE